MRQMALQQPMRTLCFDKDNKIWVEIFSPVCQGEEILLIMARTPGCTSGPD
jgi:hypothetical protein